MKMDRFLEFIVSLVMNLDYKTVSVDKSLSEDEINNFRNELEEFGYSPGNKKKL